MHLAQFVHRYPPALGGAESYTSRLCDYLVSRGDTVRLWTSSAIELEEMWHPGRTGFARIPDGEGKPEVVRYRPLHFPLRRYLLKALSLVPHRQWQCLTSPCNPICPGMWRDCQRWDGPLDAVHAVAFPYSFPIICAWNLARRRGVPFYLTPFLHIGNPDRGENPTRRQYTRPHLCWLLAQADGIFVQTNLERDAVLALGIPSSRVVVQGLGVDSAECTGGDRQRLRSRLGIAGDEVLIGHLANNSEEKGTCDLLRAAERLWSRGTKFRILLAGPEMPNFRAFWGRYRPRQGVLKLGLLSEPEKRDFFAAIDAFVLPSRTDSFGLVLLEAWANARPNLVYRAGGPAELVLHGRDGLQSRCGDLSDLTGQLQRLVESEELRRELGENGYERAARDFRWRDKLELVRKVLQGGTDRPTVRSRLVRCRKCRWSTDVPHGPTGWVR